MNTKIKYSLKTFKIISSKQKLKCQSLRFKDIKNIFNVLVNNFYISKNFYLKKKNIEANFSCFLKMKKSSRMN